MDEFDFDLYMLGSNYPGIFKSEHYKRIYTLPWVPFEAHSYRMMSLQPDIAIIPLANDAFNQFKSAIKWYEMSAFGVPSVVSNVGPYKEVVTDKTALPYSNSTQFYESLKQLLTNKGKRLNIGNSAYQWVRENKSLEVESKKLQQKLKELCQK